MGVALHGNIVDFGLAEVFQLIGQQRKSGMLEISHRKLTMRLHFADGFVVSAAPHGSSDHGALGELMVRCGLLTPERLAELASESETSARPLPVVLTASGEVTPEQLESMVDLLTQETIFQVLRWTEGSFHFSARKVEHDRPQDRLLAAEQILMDGLRMVDEWRTFAALVPSGDTVFERSGSFAVYREQYSGDAGERAALAERLFHLIDGRLSVRRVIDLSRLGTFEGTRILADLRRAGVIGPVDARIVRRLSQSESDWKPVFQRVRWAVAVCVPLLVLGFATALTFGADGPLARIPVASPPDRPGWAIPRDPVETSRQAFQVRRLRNALETRRYLEGDWPASLAGVAALTPSEAAAYYYVRREDDILLLAPQR
ncbi:MAG: DUF4388 domain-containing protein [Myxococcota bacterium]